MVTFLRVFPPKPLKHHSTQPLRATGPAKPFFFFRFDQPVNYSVRRKNYRRADKFLAPTRKETSSEAYQGRARFQQHRYASCHQVFFFLQGKAPKEIHAILTET